MPFIEQTVRLKIVLNGGTLDNALVLSARCSFGFDQRVSEATVSMVDRPDGIARWQVLELSADAPIDGTSPPVDPTLRFWGYVVDFGWNDWEQEFTIICRGPLHIAELTENLSEDPRRSDYFFPGEPQGEDMARFEMGGTASVQAGSTTVTTTNINFTVDFAEGYVITVGDARSTNPDPSFHGESHRVKTVVDENTLTVRDPFTQTMVDEPVSKGGVTDAEMVDRLLRKANLQDRYTFTGGGADTLGGTGRVLGRTALLQFVWQRGESLMDMIERIDQATGFRTFETLGEAGQQVFRLQQPAKPKTSLSELDANLAFGRDVFPGATSTTEHAAARNRVVVTSSFDDGSGTIPYIVTGTHPDPPPGVTYVSHTFDSPMIERFNSADAGDGLSQQEVAERLLDFLNRILVRTTLTTWLDTRFGPGQTHGIYNGGGAGMPSPCYAWLQTVVIDVTPESFTQSLTYVWEEATPAQTPFGQLGSLPFGLG